MLKHILLLLAGMIVLSSTGQDTTFFDSDWEEVETRDSASYFRVDKRSGDIIERTDYYISGDVQMTGKYDVVVVSASLGGSKEKEIESGEFVWYYPRGQKNRVRTYKDGQEIRQETYFLSGQMRGVIKWVPGEEADDPYLKKYVSWWDSLGNQTMEAGKGDFVEYYLNGGVKRIGHVKDGDLDGDIISYNGKGIKTIHLKYRDGEFIKGINYADGGEIEFKVMQQMPEFTGGDMARIKYIANSLKYPAEAIQNNVQGKVYVQFVILSDGSVSDVQVLKGIGLGCDEEAARVVREMPDWEPGSQYGMPVNVKFVMPIVFRLQ